MEEAIELEVERQIDLLEDGGTVIQETRLYNGETRTARTMRTKEEATDYRYFPCPDLLPVVLDDATIEAIAADLPELPDARHRRFVEDYGLSDYDAGVLGDDAAMANYFEAVARECGDAKQAANWIMGELSARLNSEDRHIGECPVRPEDLGLMVTRILDGTLSTKMAKEVLDAMWRGEGGPDAVIEDRGLRQVTDSTAIEKMVDEVIAKSPNQVDNYRGADPKKRPKMLGYFVGQVMKASGGQADPKQVNDILKEKLDALL